MTLSELRARVETDVLTVNQARALIDAAEALDKSPCGIDGFDRLVWRCKERDCARCAALSALRDAGLEVT